MTDPIADGTSLEVTLGGQLRELQRWVYAVPVIIAANVGLYVWQSVGVGDGQSMLRGDVIADFGDHGGLVSDGQWWRVLTGMWLHANLLHLVGNLVAFAIIGRSVERMVGWRGFAIMYVLSGIGGSFATYAVTPYAITIGASGAIYGVFGCVVGFTLRYPGKFPSEGLRTLMWAGLAYLLYSFAFTLGPGISWTAHAGGFATGVVCGGALSAPIEPYALPGRRMRDARLALGGAAVVAAVLFGMQGRIASTSDAIAHLFDRDARLAAEVAASLPDARAAAPALAESRAYIASLDELPERSRALLGRIDAYLEQRERAWSMFQSGLAAGDFDALETARARHAAADARAAELYRVLSPSADGALADPVPIAPLLDPIIARAVAAP